MVNLRLVELCEDDLLSLLLGRSYLLPAGTISMPESLLLPENLFITEDSFALLKLDDDDELCLLDESLGESDLLSEFEGE